jgi:DNA-binding transcriptional regulator YiaG
MATADIIKKLRLELGLELYEFGYHMGVSTGTVCNWEAGRRNPRLPKIRKMVELAKKHKIKVSIQDFLND